MEKEKTENNKRILLEVVVLDDGKMLLEATGDRVRGVAVGEPKKIEFCSIPGNRTDVVTSWMGCIRGEASRYANAYSVGKTWDGEEGSSNQPFYVDQTRESDEIIFHQTVQYFRLDKKSVGIARSRIF